MIVAPGVHQFETYPFNWYLIEENSQLTLVDAGFPRNYNTFVAGLRSIGRELSDVKAIVLTQVHADHTGFAERLRRELDIPILVHEDELPASQHVRKVPPSGLLFNAWRPFVARYILGNALIFGAPQTESIIGGTTFRHGDVLDVPSRRRVIHTPGHTAGSCLLFLEDRRVLFSGDAVVTLHLLTGEDVGPCVPPTRVNEDFLQARRSVVKLSELGTFTLPPGHGRPWTGTAESLIEAVGALSCSQANNNEPLELSVLLKIHVRY